MTTRDPQSVRPARDIGARVAWNRIGVVFSLSIIAIAAVVLYRALKDTDVDRVVDAIRTTDGWRAVLAACAVATSYLTLTFYDFFALRTLGYANVPYRTVARASFTSYSIGHN